MTYPPLLIPRYPRSQRGRSVVILALAAGCYLAYVALLCGLALLEFAVNLFRQVRL